MANAMLNHDEFPTSTSSADWLHMCESGSENSISNSMVVPLQTQQHQLVPSPITRKPSYEKMIGIPTAISNLKVKRSSSLLLSSISTATALTSATLPQRKSVDFANLPLPSPKRMRQQIISLSLFSNHTPKWTTKQVVEGLSICISSQERINVIQEARHAFNHDDQSKHNEEIMNNVDKALIKHLTYLLYQYSNTISPVVEPNQESSTSVATSGSDGSCNLRLDLALTCDALESIYRATSEIVGLSFRRIGPELLHRLIGLIHLEIHQRHQSLLVTTNAIRTGQQQDSPQSEEEKRDMDDSIYQSLAKDGIMTVEGDLLLRQATKILAHYARVGEATKPMAHFSGLLGCLIRLINSLSYDLVPWDARLSALWILANLACNADNMLMMASTASLVQSLVDVANRPLTPNDTLEMMMEKLRSRSIASRAILNLSWAAENKILLAENKSLLDLVANLCILRVAPNEVGFAQNSTTIQSIFDTTRRHAVGALRNIAAAPRQTKIALCHYRDGHLLDVLTDAAWNDADQHVKDRALATIHNLAVHDTAHTIASRSGLVMVLKEVLLNATKDNTGGRMIEDGTNSDPHLMDGTPRQHAQSTILVLERTITPDMECYANLRDLLNALNHTSTNMEITAV